MAIARTFFVTNSPTDFSLFKVYAGQEIPAEILHRVTNPDILNGEEPEPDPEEPDPEEPDPEEPDPEEPDPEDQGETFSDSGDTPNSSWKKDDLIEYAELSGLQLDGSETKSQLLELIEELEQE